MNEYVFVGWCSILDDVTISQFGQSVQLPEDKYRHHLANGAALLPRADFDAIGFDSKDLAKFHSTLLHDRAPADFVAKRNLAWQKVHDAREALDAPKPNQEIL